MKEQIHTSSAAGDSEIEELLQAWKHCDAQNLDTSKAQEIFGRVGI